MGSRKLPISNGSFKFLMHTDPGNYDKARKMLAAYLKPEISEAEVDNVLNKTISSRASKMKIIFQNSRKSNPLMWEKHSAWLAQGIQIPVSILRSDLPDEFPCVVDFMSCSNITNENSDGLIIGRTIPNTNISGDCSDPATVRDADARSEYHQDLPNLTIGELKTLRQSGTMNHFINTEIKIVKPYLKKHLNGQDLGLLRQTLTNLKETFHRYWADSHCDNNVFERKYKNWLESPVRVPMSLLHNELSNTTVTTRCSNCQEQVCDTKTQGFHHFDTDGTGNQDRSESLQAFKTVFEGLLKWNNNVKLPKLVTSSTLPLLCSDCDKLLIGIYKMYKDFMGRTSATAPIHIILGNSNAWKPKKPSISVRIENDSPELLYSYSNETSCGSLEVINPQIPSEHAYADFDHREETTEVINESEYLENNTSLSPSQQEDTGAGTEILQNANTLPVTVPDRLSRRKQSFKNFVQNPKRTMFKCPYCPRKFHAMSIFNRHVKWHSTTPSIPCTQCGESVQTKYHLAVHIRTIHKKNQKRSFPCPVKNCPTAHIATSRLNLSSHFFRVHPGLTPPLPFVCNECGKRFSGQAILDNHVFARHSTHRCEVCNKTFNSTTNLNSHVKSHKLVLVDCNICGKKLNSKGLPTHLKTHDENRKREYLCDLCGTGFYTSESHRQHIKTIHEGLKESVCVHCGQRFTRGNGLKCHLEAKHGTEHSAFPCPICGKEFKARDYLKQHLRSKVHGGPGQKRDRVKRKSQLQNEDQTETDQLPIAASH